MTILALTLKTWMLIVAVHGHGPNHGHNVTQGSYYNSQSACETAAAEIKMRLNLQGVPATAACVETGGS